MARPLIPRNWETTRAIKGAKAAHRFGHKPPLKPPSAFNGLKSRKRRPITLPSLESLGNLTGEPNERSD
jgi:hypothetical protein